MDDLISRKAVLSILHNKAFDSVKNDEKYNLLRWCMKQIESLPTIQPQGIDKGRLIEEFKNAMTPHLGSDSDFAWNMALSTAIDIANEQPTTDGWIPCSSGKLPKEEDYSEDGFVLVQTGGGIIYKGCYEIESGFWVDETGFKFAYLPIAWQPLPPAYKESENNV